MNWFLIKFVLNDNEGVEKSKKELEQFILSENRNKIIGFVNTKTLRKWKVLTDPKDYDWLEKNVYPSKRK